MREKFSAQSSIHFFTNEEMHQLYSLIYMRIKVHFGKLSKRTELKPNIISVVVVCHLKKKVVLK